MPATYYQPFQVLYYESDANGQMHPINYLRRMQEAAFAASSAVGYDFDRYTEMGHLWLVRETQIEYLHPLAYGDQVEIKTWVHDFRRFRSRRMYEFRKKSTNQLAARAATDWVFINSATLRPAVIPDEMRLAFFPEGIPEENGSRERFPAPEVDSAEAFSIRQRVGWADIDTMWHVNNAVYLAYAEAAEMAFLEVRGWPVKRMLEAGFRLAPKEQRIEYRQPAILGDELEISGWLTNLQPAQGLGHYQIHRAEDGALLAQAQNRWVCVDQQSGQEIAIPEDFRHALNGV
jgi:acyl-CoA thioester hydrolase